MVKVPVRKAVFTVKGTGRKIILTRGAKPSPTVSRAKAPPEKRKARRYIYEKGKLVAVIEKDTGKVLYAEKGKIQEVKETLKAQAKRQPTQPKTMKEGIELAKKVVTAKVRGKEYPIPYLEPAKLKTVQVIPTDPYVQRQIAFQERLRETGLVRSTGKERGLEAVGTGITEGFVLFGPSLVYFGYQALHDPLRAGSEYVGGMWETFTTRPEYFVGTLIGASVYGIGYSGLKGRLFPKTAETEFMGISSLIRKGEHPELAPAENLIISETMIGKRTYTGVWGFKTRTIGKTTEIIQDVGGIVRGKIPRKFREPITTYESFRFGGKSIAGEPILKTSKYEIKPFIYKTKAGAYAEMKIIPKRAYDYTGITKISARYKPLREIEAKGLGLAGIERGEPLIVEEAGFRITKTPFKTEVVGKGKAGRIPERFKGKIYTEITELEELIPEPKQPKVDLTPYEYPDFFEKYPSKPPDVTFAKTGEGTIQAQKLSGEMSRMMGGIQAQIVARYGETGVEAKPTIPMTMPKYIETQIEIEKPQIILPEMKKTRIKKPVTIEINERELKQFYGTFGIREITTMSKTATFPTQKIVPLEAEIPKITPTETPTITPIDVITQKTKMKEITPYPEIIPPIPKPPYMPILPFIPPIGGGFGRRRKRRKRRKKQPKRYRPSLTAVVFGIKGKRPRVLTGMGVRPMPLFKKRKRSKRKKKRKKKRKRR